MAQHNDTGKTGELLARRHLEEHGYAILKTNWKLGKYEVDIIAYKEGLIVFVEVKTRSHLDHGNPEDFVDRTKQRAYIRMANKYVIDNRRPEEVRFDIIAVDLSSTGSRITHIKDAFSPVGQYLQ